MKKTKKSLQPSAEFGWEKNSDGILRKVEKWKLSEAELKQGSDHLREVSRSLCRKSCEEADAI